MAAVQEALGQGARQQRDETDARASIVQLSPLGRKLERAMRTERHDYIVECLDGWSDRELRNLLPLLEKLAKGLVRRAGFPEP